MKSVVLFDMDGILCDFVGGACRVHGSALHREPHLVTWDFPSQIGFTGASDPAFWRPLENPTFWANLEPLADGIALFRAVEAAIGKDRIGFLSSGLCPGSCDGKRDWIARHLPGYEKRALFGTVKELVAGQGKILIDDHDPNVDKFIALGGWSVLAPRPWNRRAGEAVDGRFDVQKVLGEVAAAW